MNVRVAVGALAATVLAAACADDATEGSTEPGGERLYVLWSGLSGPELDTNYITPIRSLDAGGVVDYGSRSRATSAAAIRAASPRRTMAPCMSSATTRMRSAS
jgi:hypothetical protein